MSLSETLKAAAKAAGTENEVTGVEEVIVNLQEGKTKNIAILGEANCGKTSLINRLAGMEVRKPTKISMDEAPLMVTFHSGEEKEGYEIMDVSAPKCEEAEASLYEIPVHMAVDDETGQAALMLEEMDAVIYITSAVTPFSASDAANIEAVVNRFPMILYVSKMDLLENDEERTQAMEYIKEEFSRKFEGTDCEILDSLQADAADAILEGIKELALEELREFHIMRLEQQARDIVAQGLRRQLVRLEEKRKEREASEAATNDAYRQQLLEWDELRLRMLEKKQDAADIVDKEITRSKLAVKKDLTAQLGKADDKKKWMNHRLGKELQTELESVSRSVMEKVRVRAESDAAWLVNEVNKKFGVAIDVTDMKGNGTVQVEEGSGDAMETPGKGRLVAAAGSGLVAGGAFFSSMPLIPTSIVVVPALMAMYHFVKKDREDQEQYIKNLERITGECCDKNFAALAGQIQAAIDTHYGNIVENIRNLGSRKKTTVDFSDLEEQRARLSGMLENLSR